MMGITNVSNQTGKNKGLMPPCLPACRQVGWAPHSLAYQSTGLMP